MTSALNLYPTPLFDAELARADLYGVLSALTYAPPSAELMSNLRASALDTDAPKNPLQTHWLALTQLACGMTEQDIAAEYQSLFGGVGKPEVALYASHYLTGFLNEKPLARLRSELIKLGLTHAQTMSEPEDHFAYLCEVMRYLIAQDSDASSSLSRQRNFFVEQLQPWVSQLCDELQHHPKARFYAALAGLAAVLMQIEAEGFEMQS